MKCLYCGKLISDEDVFCGYCGKNIKEIEKEEEIKNKNLKLEKEKAQFSKDIIIETEGNKFKAIKEFRLKYNVDNDTASKYINEAYTEINQTEEKMTTTNSANSNSIESIVERNSNQIVPSIKEVREIYGYGLIEAQEKIDAVINKTKNVDSYVDPKGIKKTMIVASSSRKKATSAIGRGIVGGAILGPIGLLAGTTAKTKDTTTFLIIYNSGKQETITVKNGGWMFNQYCKYLDK